MKMVKANEVHIEVASLEDIKEIFTGYKSIKNIYLYQKHGYDEFKTVLRWFACNDIFGEKCKLEMKKSSFSSWKLLLILSSISILVMYVETMLLPAIPDIIRV